MSLQVPQIQQGQAPQSGGSICAPVKFFGQRPRQDKKKLKKLKNRFFVCHNQFRKNRSRTVTAIPLIHS